MLALIFVCAAVPVQANQMLVKQRPPKFASCLPSDVKADEVAVYDRRKNITIAENLKSLKARCSKGRLLGRDNKEIKFFRLMCFGYPPPNYLEIQAEQRRKLSELKAKYTVVTIGCDSRIP